MKKILITILFFFTFLDVNAETKIAYIDVEQILNKSLVGKSINIKLNTIKDENNKRFKEIRLDLKNEEEKILSQKNFISESEFKKKKDDFKIKADKYLKDVEDSNNKLNKIKIEYTKKVLQKLNPIITKYVEDNLISIVIPKKNIIIGKKNLDITQKIINLIDTEIKEINN